MTALQQLDTLLWYFYRIKDKTKAINLDHIKMDVLLLEMAGNKDELERMVIMLRDDKYIQIYPDYYRDENDKQDMSRGIHTFCSIRFEGRLFIEGGGYERAAKRKKISEFPKTYWWAIALFTFIVGFFADVFKERLKGEKSPSSLKVELTPPTSSDTLQNRKTLHVVIDSFPN